MKPRLHSWLGRSALSLTAPVLAIPLLLAPVGARADSSFTATAHLVGVPVPGVLVTNALGQVFLRGNVHVAMVQASDVRVTGRLQAGMDLAYQADGTGLFSGPVVHEVGTWDLTDPNAPKFTPTGGIWTMSFRGVMQADGSTQYTMAGYGVGGAIDSLRIEVTGTRDAGTPFDPAILYHVSGTIKPAPVNTSVVVDNFDDNSFNASLWRATGAGSGTLSVTEANQQLSIGGTWSSPTPGVVDHTAWVWSDPNWSAANGQTVELRTDLPSLKPTAGASAAIGLYHASGQGYGITKAADWIGLWKHRSPTLSVLSGIRVPTSNTNVVLVFALTPVGANVILTGKVLDQSGAVLAQLSCVDTPAADSSLSQAAFAQLTGGRVCRDVGPDTAGAPWKNGTSVFLGVFQDTDGTQPPAAATLDNVVVRTYEVPQLAIERAVQLTWPNTGMNFGVEAAPTVNGPWLPVQDSVPPGFDQMTLPQSGPMQFFRLQQAP